MDENVRSIEEATIAVVTANIRATVEELENRMAAKDAGKGEFDISTVEDLGLELIEKTKRVYAEMYGQLLSEKNREQVEKKRPQKG